jgi:hypothetical protein
VGTPAGGTFSDTGEYYTVTGRALRGRLERAGRLIQGYNAQNVVSEDGLIIAAEVACDIGPWD